MGTVAGAVRGRPGPVIAFVTLLLGLVTGQQVVEVAVSGRVATVELRLDGRVVERLNGEPWRAKLDFGPELTTHQLVAVARDGAGAEVGRAVQQINVPRPQIETEILLDGWERGRPRYARLIWRSAELLEPDSVAVSLDGEALDTGDPARIELPDVDPVSLHFLSAELTFPGSRRSTAQSVFGGRYGVEVESELTAVPVVPGDRRLHRGEEADNWLRGPGGEPMRVVAVEEDVAELLIVRDDAARASLGRLHRKLRGDRRHGYGRLSLPKGDRLFLMSARAHIAAHPEVDYQLYPVSRPFGREEASLLEALSTFGLSGEPGSAQRLSDAVAVAGVRAAAGGRRRAVLLVVSGCAASSGSWSGDTVRRFLTELRVPLVVWVTRKPRAGGDGFCPGARRIDSASRYLKAVRRLRRRLERQQVLWVEGRHLPREIVLADGAPAAEVAQLN